MESNLRTYSSKKMATVKSDEKLAFEVRKFPCLYDKSLSSYKENQPKKNAWKEIDQALGNPEGDVQKELVFFSQ